MSTSTTKTTTTGEISARKFPRQTERDGETAVLRCDAGSFHCARGSEGSNGEWGGGSGVGEARHGETNQSAEWLSLRVLNYGYFV